MNKTVWRNAYLWLGICAALQIAAMIAGCFVDFDLAQSAYRPDNGLTMIFEAVGKMPGYAAAGFACAVLFACASAGKKGAAKVVLCIVYWVGGMLCGALVLLDLFDLLIADGVISLLVSVGVGAALFQLTLFLTVRSAFDAQKYKKWAFAALISVLIVMAMIAIAKAIWDRARFEDVLFEGKIFTPCWTRGDGGSSMPSGHTAIAWTGFLWVPFLSIGGKSYFKQGAACGIFALWTALTAISRLIGGKHFLSDVAVGGLIGCVAAMTVCAVMLGAYFQNARVRENGVWDKL